MSTITIRGIPVKLPTGLPGDKLTSFKHFITWLDTLLRSLEFQKKDGKHPFHKDPYELKSITVQAFDKFGHGENFRIGFLKLTADVVNGAGSTLPGAVFLRGPAVAMLVLLVPEDGGGGDERYVPLTVQPRIPAGSTEFVELPAGMVDGDGAFAGAAAREMKEELDIEIREDELVCLSELAAAPGGGGSGGREGLPLAMYPSAGGCDEHITIYAHERKVTRKELAEWNGKYTGLRDEGEHITLKIVKMQDLWKEGARDAKSLAAVTLYDALSREGKLQPLFRAIHERRAKNAS